MPRKIPDEEEIERSPISSLIGQTISGFVQTNKGFEIINVEGETIATVNTSNWTLFDEDGNYFEDDSHG